MLEDFSVDEVLNHIFTPDNFELPYCFNVSIEDDLALEEAEFFHLNVFTDDISVNFKISSILVEIQDNDSKCCTAVSTHVHIITSMKFCQHM